MIDEVYPNLYRIEIPLPRNPLKSLNSYVIKGSSRNLIVDTGMMGEAAEKIASQTGRMNARVNRLSWVRLTDDDCYLVSHSFTAPENDELRFAHIFQRHRCPRNNA